MRKGGLRRSGRPVDSRASTICRERVSRSRCRSSNRCSLGEKGDSVEDGSLEKPSGCVVDDRIIVMESSCNASRDIPKSPLSVLSSVDQSVNVAIGPKISPLAIFGDTNSATTPPVRHPRRRARRTNRRLLFQCLHLSFQIPSHLPLRILSRDR